MKSLNGLSAEIKPCPDCGERRCVNYWAHSDDHNCVRYQCSRCSTQVPDFNRMDIGPDEYVERMGNVLEITRTEYIFRFGGQMCLYGDELILLFRLLED